MLVELPEHRKILGGGTLRLIETHQPTVYVIAGPNGAGKTTFSEQYLLQYANCDEFVNADIIAAEISPDDPTSQALVAGRMMLDRIDELSERRETFSFETTLAGRSHAQRLSRLKKDFGYTIELDFLWLPSPELAVQRVATRVQQGGHDIPEPTIRRRYRQGTLNFARLYSPIVDRWIVFDASRTPPAEIMRFEDGEMNVSDDSLFDFVKRTTPEMIP